MGDKLISLNCKGPKNNLITPYSVVLTISKDGEVKGIMCDAFSGEYLIECGEGLVSRGCVKAGTECKYVDARIERT